MGVQQMMDSGGLQTSSKQTKSGASSLVFHFNTVEAGKMPPQKHVALLLKSLKAGGMQTSLLKLASGIADRGVKVDVIVAGKLSGPIRDFVPENVHLVSLPRSMMPWPRLRQALQSFDGNNGIPLHSVPLPMSPPRAIKFLPGLVRYLSREQPDSLIAAGTGYNLISLWARRISGVKTKVIVSERNSITAEINSAQNRDQWQWRHAKQLVANAYPEADAIVGNSDGVSSDLADCTGLRREIITTIYNPIVNEALKEKALETVEHPWFAPDAPPVILGVGRMHPQKDFSTLIKAFARLRAERSMKLVIIGSGTNHGVKDELTSLAKRLGVLGDVDFPGFASNPYAYMAKAKVFVLSSKYEGCPNVLVEAMACSCPVVSTRCPYGPDEILEDGRYGPLVAVGDDEEMAKAIAATLDKPKSPEALMKRASHFDFASSVDKYLRSA